MCELSPSTPQQADVMFSDLAGAFHMLHYFNKEWSEDAIVSVVDELSSLYLLITLVFEQSLLTCCRRCS
jgi:hypothetical protein